MAVSTWTSNGLYVPQHHHPHQQYGCHMSSAYQPHHQQYPHPQHQQQPYATISRTSSSTLKRRPAYDPIIPIPYSSSPPPSPCSSSRSPPFTPAQATRLYCVVVHNFYCHNNKPNSSTPATALTLPPHSLSTFVSRLVRASGVSTQIILLALIYVFRLRPHGSSSSSSSSSSLLSPASASIPSTTLQKPTSPLDPSPPQFHIPSPPASPCPPDLKHYDLDPTTSPLHTLVATTIILAQKVTDDNRFTNKTWSELANIRLETINSMERSVLERLRWKVNVDAATWTDFVEWCVKNRTVLEMKPGGKLTTNTMHMTPTATPTPTTTAAAAAAAAASLNGSSAGGEPRVTTLPRSRLGTSDAYSARTTTDARPTTTSTTTFRSTTTTSSRRTSKLPPTYDPSPIHYVPMIPYLPYGGSYVWGCCAGDTTSSLPSYSAAHHHYNGINAGTHGNVTTLCHRDTTPVSPTVYGTGDEDEEAEEEEDALQHPLYPSYAPHHHHYHHHHPVPPPVMSLSHQHLHHHHHHHAQAGGGMYRQRPQMGFAGAGYL